MSENLRVAFLNQDLWVGGSTVFSLTLGAELIRRGVPAHVFAMGERHSLAADYERNQVPVTRLEHDHFILEDRIAKMFAAMRQFRPTVVIACVGFDPCETLRYMPPGVARIGIIHATHAGSFEWIDQYAKWLDLIVGVSRAVEDQIKSAVRFPAERITSVELGVPVTARQRKPPGKDEPLRILYLGRLEDASKRVRLFPVILNRLRELGLPFHWTIAGDGPERSFLEAAMVSSPNQTVHFAGLVNYADVPALLEQHDVILLTSDTETFSLSLHEAMAAGLVPVASDIPGRVREIVTLETGRRVAPDQPRDYADAIHWLHTHRDELAGMGEASRRIITQNFSASAMTERWLTLLKRFKPAAPPLWPDRIEFQKPLSGSRLWFHPALRPLRRRAAEAKNRRAG